MDKLKQGKAISRRYRNRRIGEFFKEIDLSEKKSTGITKILGALEKNGSPPPIFETSEGRDYMQVTIKMHEEFDLDHFAGKTSSEHDGEHDGAQVSEHDEKIQSLLEYCITPRKRDEMQRHYGIASREYFRKNVLKPLLQSGQLKMTIPNKPKSGNQRYVKS